MSRTHVRNFLVECKSQFIEMFGTLDKTTYSLVKLGDIGKMISGGTPSSSHPEYFGGKIPFISTPSLGDNFIDSRYAQTWLTELGVRNSSTHLIPSNSIMIGSRVGVCK